MKALTLWQPWASLVAAGFKKYETRPWRTTYRGPLLIHAAKREPTWVGDLLNRQLNEENRVFWHFLAQMGYEAFPQLPRGNILGIVELSSIVRTETIRIFLDEFQLVLGDFSDGRWSWRLKKIKLYSKPVPAKGRQGLWEWSNGL